MKTTAEGRLQALESCIDEYKNIFRKLRGAGSLVEYLSKRGDRADEEILTEPILRSIIERVLGFPRGAYLEQLEKSGRKPDFTPDDLIAHSFVFDAKASDENLAAHEPQIRGYMRQRRLAYGILFNLRELRVYDSGGHGHERSLSFQILPLWQSSRGEALPSGEPERFKNFCERFSHRQVTQEEKIAQVAGEENWTTRFQSGESLEIDVEALVERLRRLSVSLAADAKGKVGELEDFLSFNSARERHLQDELELLALEVAPGTDPELVPKTVKGWQSASGLAETVWRQYMLRVAYLALTRILLYRAWEDVEFVPSYLYDGGFEDWYEQLGHNARHVLDEAFLHGGQRYPWLFGRENNYDWYRPSESVLVDVLYSLAPQPLGKLDADVLGSLYATYVEDIDRDRLGQFFTPRDVVRFMLDRVGFEGTENVFRIEGTERKPLAVLDFATGSGGFLVEAARRIIEAVGPGAEPVALREALRAIVTGFTGGEISPFPYYLTEINLLLQVSRLLGPLHAAEDHPVASFGALGVLPVDTLTAKTASDRSLDLDPELRADKAEIVDDERFGLVPLDGEKRTIYRERLRQDEHFDLVIGNPPYVAEAGNRALFDRLRAIPAWKGIYRGKTDYLYYFLLLAVEKLKPGGRLCVITPAGWMNAGAADFLREKLVSELILEQLFLFGGYRVFATDDAAPTPTVETAILVATKGRPRKSHKLRVVALEDESEAPRSRHELLAEMTRRVVGRAGRRGGVLVHDVPQVTLRPELPWSVKYSEKDLAPRLVRFVDKGVEAGSLEPLTQSWKVVRGIETAADSYTRRIQKRLPTEARAQLQALGCEVGMPIMELPPGAERNSPWKDNLDLLARSPEPTAILYGAVDESDYSNLLRLTKDKPPSAAILAKLDRWRPILASRAGFAEFPNRPWWETHRARDATDLAAPKVIALYRTDRGRFALDEIGEFQPSNKTTFVVGHVADAPVAYLCGVLNSELLDLWWAVRGKNPRDVWRNYEPKRMNEMPYRPPDGDPRADQVAELVRKIAVNRKTLLPRRNVIRSLGRIVKDPWKTGPVELDEAALLSELPAGETVSIRLDTKLELAFPTPARSRPVRDTKELLVLRRGRADVGRIEGDPRRLDVLEHFLAGVADEQLPETLLPKDLEAFQKAIVANRTLVEELLAEGRRLVEEVERLVCAIYGLPDLLTDEVVAHAVARAERSTG